MDDTPMEQLTNQELAEALRDGGGCTHEALARLLESDAKNHDFIAGRESKWRDALVEVVLAYEFARVRPVGLELEEASARLSNAVQNARQLLAEGEMTLPQETINVMPEAAAMIENIELPDSFYNEPWPRYITDPAKDKTRYAIIYLCKECAVKPPGQEVSGYHPLMHCERCRTESSLRPFAMLTTGAVGRATPKSGCTGYYNIADLAAIMASEKIGAQRALHKLADDINAVLARVTESNATQLLYECATTPENPDNELGRFHVTTYALERFLKKPPSPSRREQPQALSQAV